MAKKSKKKNSVNMSGKRKTAIARGLVKWNGGAEGDDEELRDEYLRFDRSLLVNDPRRKEPKHQMGRGARKKWQKSYR